MGLFSTFTEFLTGAVGNTMDNAPDDVRQTKRNLSRLGFFDDDTENGYITRTLDDGIKGFQKKKGLKVDGRLLPAGETERSIFEALTNRKADEVFGNAEHSKAGSVGFGGNVSGTFAPVRTAKKKPNPFILNINDDGGNTRIPTPKSKPDAREKTDVNHADNPLEEQSEQFDATGRRVTDGSPPIPDRKPLDSPHRPPILKGLRNDVAKKGIRDEEGNDILYMYKDTAQGGGKVTVGVGIMLPDAKFAKTIPFEIKGENGNYRKATPKEIERAFNKVDGIYNKNDAAKSFRPNMGDHAKKNNLDDLILPLDVSDRLLDERLRVDAARMRDLFPKFDSYSPKRQQAILDMQFNLGSTKFRDRRIVNGVEKGWPNLFDAIRQEDWQRAAKESHRVETGLSGMVDRNSRTRDKFLDGLPPLN